MTPQEADELLREAAALLPFAVPSNVCHQAGRQRWLDRRMAWILRYGEATRPDRPAGTTSAGVEPFRTADGSEAASIPEPVFSRLAGPAPEGAK